MIRRDDKPLLEFLRSQTELQQLQSDWTFAVNDIRSRVELHRSNAHEVSSELMLLHNNLESIRDEIRDMKAQIKKTHHELQIFKRGCERTQLEIESTTIEIEKAKLEKQREQIMGYRALVSPKRNSENLDCSDGQTFTDSKREVKVMTDSKHSSTVLALHEAKPAESKLPLLRQENLRLHCEAVLALESLKSLFQELGITHPNHSTVESIPETFAILRSMLITLNGFLESRNYLRR